MTEFIPLAGDKKFAEDKSIIGGLARLNDTPIVIIGHEKGDDTKSRIQHNFGMARPEGYRKAVRLMDLADKFNLPVITFIDTPGAYPGNVAEETLKKASNELSWKQVNRTTLADVIPLTEFLYTEEFENYCKDPFDKTNE